MEFTPQSRRQFWMRKRHERKARVQASAAVLQAVVEFGPLTLQEAMARTGLDRAACGQALDGLRMAGVVELAAGRCGLVGGGWEREA